MTEIAPPTIEVEKARILNDDQVNDDQVNEGVSEEQSAESDDNPKVPDIAWQGMYRRYRDLMCTTTEASDNFHWAVFNTIFGLTLNHNVSVEHAGVKYANFYTALVGATGNARKDTAWKGGNGILSRLHDRSDDSVGISPGFGSIEKLVDKLAGHRKVRLLISTELSVLMSKAAQKGTGNCVPVLTHLYDCPEEYSPDTRGNSVTCKEPFLSIFAGTTPAWLYRDLTLNDIEGGFGNRWIYIFGKNKGPIGNPPRVDDKKRTDLVSEINSIRQWARALPNNGCLNISLEAENMFNEWYQKYYERTQEDGLIPVLSVRIQDQVWKISMLYAAQDRSPIIEAKHLEIALAIGSFLEKSLNVVFKNFGSSSSKKGEDRVREYLKKGPQWSRDICRNLNISSSELIKIMEPAAKAGRAKLIDDLRKQDSKGKWHKGRGYKWI